jgi:hypothetical protein
MGKDMLSPIETSYTFNSALESGLRILTLLVPAYPRSYDLQTLTALDYLVVHTGDFGGPQSLHPKLPQRTSEIIVRRTLVERGLLLMISRGLIEKSATLTGLKYQAGEFSETFLSTLTSKYTLELIFRSKWVILKYGNYENDLLRQTLRQFCDQWIEEFHVAQKSLAVLS